MSTVQHIAIFASGTGTNAEAVIKHFSTVKDIEVSLIISNKSTAGVHQVAAKFGIPSVTLSKTELTNSEQVLELLNRYQVNWVVLAGFLLLVPAYLVKSFPRRIINIHPALLPKFGGKGMYGNHVHQAVYDAKEVKTGITVHFVNEVYDEGQILGQESVTLTPDDKPEAIRLKVQKLEHQYFPKLIEQTIRKSLVINQK